MSTKSSNERKESQGKSKSAEKLGIKQDKSIISYEEWSKRFEGKTDLEISEEFKNMILAKNEMTPESKRLFEDTYNYIKNHIVSKKPFSTNTLFIHLKDVKHYDMAKVDIISTLLLVNACGLFIEIDKPTV